MQQTKHYHLTVQKTLTVELVAGDVVHVASGSIWLTLEGHARDVWLNPQDSWCVPVRAKAWFGSDSDASFCICSHSPVPAIAPDVRQRRPSVALA